MPLPAALRVFEAKVDGTLAPGRWLYAITPQAESRLNSLSDAWARALIGADAWRNAAVAHFVIGWRRSGYGRAIEAIARRRARLWLLPPSDFYKGFFVRAHSLPGNTWAKQSLELLRNWNISDFPENARSDKSYRQYCSYVRETIISRCSQCWQPLLSKHAYPMTLVDAEAANTTITNVLRGFWMESNLATLFNARAYCRTLAGVIDFLPKRTRSMRASAHKCPFCDVFFRDAYEHVLCRCVMFATQRLAFTSALGTDHCPNVATMLNVSVDSDAFGPLCALLDRIDSSVESENQTVRFVFS